MHVCMAGLLAVCAYVCLCVCTDVGRADMVVSGVPERTDKHACHVAVMSLEVVQACKAFKIPHASEPLYIRVGLGSGTSHPQALFF